MVDMPIPWRVQVQVHFVTVVQHGKVSVRQRVCVKKKQITALLEGRARPWRKPVSSSERLQRKEVERPKLLKLGEEMLRVKKEKTEMFGW
eukprot:m.58515 g.58515  ORF g.58515 m.58515 type:complete len:90 (+) comp15911_c0_seq1:225-494(+)